METTKTVARVNSVSILMIQEDGNHVPIKPICEALGIAEEPQMLKIKGDEILSSVTTLKVATGSDGKQYKMNCIPFMYVFGWLFTINPKNVKPEAQEAVTRYKLECYNALFKHFTDQSEFLQQKQNALEKQIEEVDRIRENFKDTKMKLDEAKKMLNEVRAMTFEQWQANNNQLKLDFPVSNDDDEN